MHPDIGQWVKNFAAFGQRDGVSFSLPLAKPRAFRKAPRSEGAGKRFHANDPVS
jgi:hypothetical protein